MIPSRLIIAAGSASEQKIGYLEEVLNELGAPAEIIPCNVPSGVSEQPMTSTETLMGAANRAAAALAAAPSSDYGIGIEVGYEAGPDGRYEIFCWAAIINRSGERFQARSHGFVLPHFHHSLLKKGASLGERVQEYFAAASDPITQYIAEAVRNRKLFITESLRYALIYALHREFYADTLMPRQGKSLEQCVDFRFGRSTRE